MKRILSWLALTLLIAYPVFAGAVKKTKSEVTFKGFGTFTSVQTEKVTPEKKLSDSKNDFKGKGIVGSISGKFLLRSGDLAEIVNLNEMTICTLDHKKKEYQVTPIKPVEESVERKAEEPETQKEVKTEEPAEKEPSDIKIVRSEFKVENTGENKVINQFPSTKYVITWITEWENVRTGQKGTDRLTTNVWTTPITDAVQQAQEEEAKFSREYLKRLGIDTDAVQQAILGINWLSMFSGLTDPGAAPKQKASQFAEEMKKIEGYPVVIDGKYYAVKEGGEQAEQEEEEAQDVKGVLGKFAKKALTKKPKPQGDEPSFSYYIELLAFSPAPVSEADFQIPPNYKKKG